VVQYWSSRRADPRLLAWRARFSRLVNFLGHLAHWKSLVLISFSVKSPKAGEVNCAGLVISAEDIELPALEESQPELVLITVLALSSVAAFL
jgi:hypothetical protein